MDWNVSVDWAVPLAARVKGESVQEILSLNDMPHVRLPEPARPFWLVKMRVVETDWPGAEIVSADGFAATEKVAAGVTVSVKVALDGL